MISFGKNAFTRIQGCRSARSFDADRCGNLLNVLMPAMATGCSDQREGRPQFTSAGDRWIEVDSRRVNSLGPSKSPQHDFTKRYREPSSLSVVAFQQDDATGQLRLTERQAGQTWNIGT